MQVFATDFWFSIFCIRSKDDAHDAFSDIFARDGMPPSCICDNLKDIIQGKFHCKVAHA